MEKTMQKPRAGVAGTLTTGRVGTHKWPVGSQTCQSSPADFRRDGATAYRRRILP